MIVYSLIQILLVLFALLFFGGLLDEKSPKFDKILALIGWALSIVGILFIQGVLKC